MDGTIRSPATPTAALVRTKYGPSTYQEERNAFHRNAHDQFLIELGKWGLGKMDLVANINFFSKVTVDAEGKMRFVAGNSTAGSYVDLRAEMDTLLVLNTCQHPMDPDPQYNPKPVHIAVWKSDPPAADDPAASPVRKMHADLSSPKHFSVHSRPTSFPNRRTEPDLHLPI